MLTSTMLALVLSSGVALALTRTCEANVDCLGTNDPDILRGLRDTDDSNNIYGRGGADILKGFGGADELYGQGGSDELFGGAGMDYLAGGPANDALSGGADSFDYYHFGPGWGEDSIADSDTPANRVSFYKGPSDFVYVTEDLTIDLVSGDGPEAETESGTSTVNWERNVIQHVFGGSGDDRITGNSLGNHIYGGSGADNISAGGGNDEIRVRDGSGDDVVDCGEPFFGSDDDTVFFDSGDQIDPSCELQLAG